MPRKVVVCAGEKRRHQPRATLKIWETKFYCPNTRVRITSAMPGCM
ncbi:hypothetical protein M5J15_08075 [Serratia symbiotica]|nr:hypothetical protein [Serratia symbiotica]USS96785.1 hypothetical protein M5J15_08075 [Serratia symbiotica]